MTSQIYSGSPWPDPGHGIGQEARSLPVHEHEWRAEVTTRLYIHIVSGTVLSAFLSLPLSVCWRPVARCSWSWYHLTRARTLQRPGNQLSRESVKKAHHCSWCLDGARDRYVGSSSLVYFENPYHVIETTKTNHILHIDLTLIYLETVGKQFNKTVYLFILKIANSKIRSWTCTIIQVKKEGHTL